MLGHLGREGKLLFTTDFSFPIYGFVHPHQKAIGKRIKNALSVTT